MNENQIQRAVFDHLRQRGARGVFAFHPKNGGVHQKGRRRGINAGLGVVSGVPDIIIIKEGRVSALELKAGKGRLSENQVTTHLQMIQCGCNVHVAFGLDDAIDWLEAKGFLKGRTKTASHETRSAAQ